MPSSKKFHKKNFGYYLNTLEIGDLNLFYKSTRSFIIPVRAVLASAFAAVAPLEVIIFCEHDVSLLTHVVILGIEVGATADGAHGFKHTGIAF